MHFVHENVSQRVRFATGEAAPSLRAELQQLGATRAMVIASASESERSEQITSDLPVVLRHTEVAMHVPVEVAERAREAASRHEVDAVISIGGGSTTGLAKAVALTTGLPIIAIPTTYSGSEATNVWGLTENKVKTTGVDARVLPRAVIYDASLTLSLPIATSIASGLNALAHCVDSMWGPRSDPIDKMLAQEGIRALRTGLPRLISDPSDLDGRESALFAAYLSAVAFSSAGSGLHHKICHVLGGKFNLPHAQTHAVVLPYVLSFNAPAAPEAEQRIADAFGVHRAIDGLQDLRRELDAPQSLRDFGFEESSIEGAVTAIMPSIPSNNPRPVTREDLVRLLRAALQGADPRLVSEKKA